MAYFLTFTTYGSHLPGDARGSTDRHLGRIPGERGLAAFAGKLMTEEPFRLEAPADRRAVRDAIVEVCRSRGWRLMALQVRVEHVHGVVQAEDATPGRVMGDWKSYSSRQLRIRWPLRKHFWTRGGDGRTIRGSVNPVLDYVLVGQGEPLETYP